MSNKIMTIRLNSGAIHIDKMQSAGGYLIDFYNKGQYIGYTTKHSLRVKFNFISQDEQTKGEQFIGYEVIR